MIRTLHVDVEGGWGGSSRSLFELLRRLDRTLFSPLVVHRQAGPITARYAELGIPTIHIPEIVSFAPRPNASLKIFVGTLPRLLRVRRAVARICTAARNHRAAIVHLNYEGLFLLAGPLRRRLGLPIICHCRTIIPSDVWGSWLVSVLSRNVDHMLFITDQEQRLFETHAGANGVPGTILWNMATPLHERLASPTPPEVVYLGNIDPTKGTDRVIEIAKELELRNSPPLRLVIYGVSRHDSVFEADLRTLVRSLRLDHRVEFRGFARDPERILAHAFALIRLSRDNAPWGRDVIEAVASGTPVLATGSYSGIVEPGVTGYLFEPFDAGLVAQRLIDLLNDRELWCQMSMAAREKGRRVFSGEAQMPVVESLFMTLASRSHDEQQGVERAVTS